MSRSQRIVVFAGSLVITTMLLFPPMSGWSGWRQYGFVFNSRWKYVAEMDMHSSKYGPPLNGWTSWRINQERLIFQILIVAVLSGGTAVLLGGKRK